MGEAPPPGGDVGGDAGGAGASGAGDDDIQDVTAEAAAARDAEMEAARVDLTLDSDDDNPIRPVRRGSPPVKREE
jgi:hypothetical protein